ncbi:MAG: hypothetical protein KTR25_10390 [Myxococcales bacterium]|nr:hypothetical protein [Myxococcales bacterium]
MECSNRAVADDLSELGGGVVRDFENFGGVHLSSSVLWCDAQRKNGLNFLSSALAGDITKSRRFLCTEETRRLAARGRGKVDVLVAPYRQSLAIGELELSLHPAGHLIGSAMIRAMRGGRVAVYTGYFSTRSSATSRPADPIVCDVLALPASFGPRTVKFPRRRHVVDEIQLFIETAFVERQTPVLLAQPLGMAQELVAELGRLGYRLRLHRSVADITKIYSDLGVIQVEYKRFSKSARRGEVVIFPPILRTSIETLIPEASVALVDPKALDVGHVHQLRIDGAFALSNMADSDDLLSFVKATGAEEVYLTGGDVDDFGARLRSCGMKVNNLQPARQLDLFDASSSKSR